MKSIRLPGGNESDPLDDIAIVKKFALMHGICIDPEIDDVDILKSSYVVCVSCPCSSLHLKLIDVCRIISNSSQYILCILNTLDIAFVTSYFSCYFQRLHKQSIQIGWYGNGQYRS